MAELPRQIGSGVLRIGPVEVEVVQLDNGMRLITQESLDRLLGHEQMIALGAFAKHSLQVEPQAIADQVMLKCACGWMEPVSVMECNTRDELLAQISKQHLEHLSRRCESNLCDQLGNCVSCGAANGQSCLRAN
jgi:hypothetical protein